MTPAPSGATVPDDATEGSIALAVGPIAALIAAGLLAQFRDGVGATNVALVLAVIVVGAALAGRMAGVVTAITAAVSFNFFHTQPYHSLRISGARDVVTVVLLAALGLIVSEIGAWRRRMQLSSTRRLHGARALEETTAMIAAGAPVDELWATIHRVLVDELHLADCRFEADVLPASLSVLPHSAALVGTSVHLTRNGFALPDEGIAMAVEGRGVRFGHIVLVPSPGTGTVLEARQLAVAMADQYAIALRLDGALPGRR